MEIICTWSPESVTVDNGEDLEAQFEDLVLTIFEQDVTKVELEYSYISETTTSVPDTSTSRDLCNDGYNGGCSHTCNDSVCQCPDCWELSDNDKTCTPASGTVLLECNSDSMTIKMNKCVAPNSNMVALTDRLCDAEENFDPDFYTITTNLDSCSTGLTQDVNGDLIFSNEIFASAYHNSIIFTSAETRIKFHCR